MIERHPSQTKVGEGTDYGVDAAPAGVDYEEAPAP